MLPCRHGQHERALNTVSNLALWTCLTHDCRLYPSSWWWRAECSVRYNMTQPHCESSSNMENWSSVFLFFLQAVSEDGITLGLLPTEACIAALYNTCTDSTFIYSGMISDTGTWSCLKLFANRSQVQANKSVALRAIESNVKANRYKGIAWHRSNHLAKPYIARSQWGCRGELPQCLKHRCCLRLSRMCLRTGDCPKLMHLDAFYQNISATWWGASPHEFRQFRECLDGLDSLESP